MSACFGIVSIVKHGGVSVMIRVDIINLPNVKKKINTVFLWDYQYSRIESRTVFSL